MTRLEMVGILTRIIHLQADIIKRQDESLALFDVRLDDVTAMKKETETLKRRIGEDE